MSSGCRAHQLHRHIVPLGLVGLATQSLDGAAYELVFIQRKGRVSISHKEHQLHRLKIQLGSVASAAEVLVRWDMFIGP